jgi:hypothetical protein
LGVFFGCLLLCAGASPPQVIIVVLSICGAITGGILESLWPKPSSQSSEAHAQITKTQGHDISISPFRDKTAVAPSRPTIAGSKRDYECQRCGEVFAPGPIICPMCGGEQSR